MNLIFFLRNASCSRGSTVIIFHKISICCLLRIFESTQEVPRNNFKIFGKFYRWATKHYFIIESPKVRCELPEVRCELLQAELEQYVEGIGCSSVNFCMDSELVCDLSRYVISGPTSLSNNSCESHGEHKNLFS